MLHALLSLLLLLLLLLSGLRKLGSTDPAFDNHWYWLQNASQLTAPLPSVGTRLLVRPRL